MCKCAQCVILVRHDHQEIVQVIWEFLFDCSATRLASSKLRTAGLVTMGTVVEEEHFDWSGTECNLCMATASSCNLELASLHEEHSCK